MFFHPILQVAAGLHPPCPSPFLEVRVHRLEATPGLTALCAGYEQGAWRHEQLASHAMEWLPEFALRFSELEGLGPQNAVRLIARAARSIYSSPKYARRGEMGEILLHAALRQVFATLPAVAKVFFKDSSNDTVKGFDAVHVVPSGAELELWLGEVKFYANIQAAISDVVAELCAHTGRDYLRGEFAAITNKIDDRWPHAERLKKLLHEGTSLDEVFSRICIPVLLTYESPTIASHTEVTTAFVQAYNAEVTAHHGKFSSAALPGKVRIHLFLVPIRSKDDLVAAFDKRLKSAQALT